MRIAALDHLVLTVADPAATAAFYERLGMRAEPFDGGRLALHFGDQKLNLHCAGAEIEPHALREQGIEIELGPVERTGARTRLRSLYLRDPDGNLVELSQPLPG
jgi:catechol 2,3-dioxygenase-like lactoylglutathione lyase family enzyme